MEGPITDVEHFFFKMKDLSHDNLNTFMGACVDPQNICVVWHYCNKGSLQVSDILLSFF